MPPDLSLICMSSLMADWSPENEENVKGQVCSLQTTRFNAHRKARPAPAHAVTPALAQSPWDTGDAGWEPSRALPPAIRSRTDSPPFGELDHPPHQGPPQRLTDVVCAVADVGRDLFHTLVVQHGLLLCESAGKLLVDSSGGRARVSAALLRQRAREQHAG